MNRRDEPRLAKKVGNRGSLIVSDFDSQQTVLFQEVFRYPEQAAIEQEPVLSAIQSDLRFVTRNVRHEPGQISRRDVGWIGNNGIE